MLTSLRAILFGLLTLTLIGLASCTGEAASNTTYDQFATHVAKQNWTAAFAMLTSTSQARFPNKEETLKALCTGPLKEAFGERAGVRNSRIINGNPDHIGGELQVFDESGKLEKRLGAWVAIRAQTGAWEVDWQLATSEEVAGRDDPYATQN